tara:strand:+ start:1179 stop:2099 length:921 start_codon:yes stop_codon:yes gene_type:complete
MYNVAIIGYGYWGPKLARNFQNSNYFNVRYIVDKSKKNLSKAKIDYPLAQLYKNYKLIKKGSVDLTIIASPTKQHFVMAKYFLKNNHVLVEKPLSISLREVKLLEKISKKNKKLLFVDYPFLFSGSINYIKKTIQSKKYGNLLEIESFREQAPVRKDTNVVWDLAVHDISILNYLLKENPVNCSSLKIKTSNKSLADTAYLNLVYKNKINVFIKNSWISPVKVRLIKFKFKKAIIYCDENEPIYKIKIFIKKKSGSQYNIKIPEIDLSEPLSELVSYIQKSIVNKSNKVFSDNLNLNVTKTLEKLG